MIPAAHAVLDLSAPRHNLQRVRDHVPGSKVMAVIKANGYGHGLLRIARALRGVDAFAVARVEEGLGLREAGIIEPIAVLEGFVCADELALVLQHHLEPVIHSMYQVEIIEASGQKSSLSVWLKLDSGMNRLGFGEHDFLEAHRRLSGCSQVEKPIRLMTHLAKADELDDPATTNQLRLFRALTEGLFGERSIANSAGILGWPEARADWVRPGIMLLGASPFPHKTGADHDLHTVMTLQSRLIAVRELEAGVAVGYGGQWVAPRKIRLGVIAIGYGDGYPRSIGNDAQVLVRDTRVPVVGRVSMDMLTVDLSSCPDAQIGDPVVLWGDQLRIEEVAAFADTIPYTLLCAVTQRVMIVEGSIVRRRPGAAGSQQYQRHG
ncbi:MAG: alanine racemase [Methylococcus sp.]|nr:MAG: alanine racemase [Methylococcus sp.]